MVKGNANFMSPEQARGQAVDARSDLYSLALALYYSLSGELLYSGNNDLEVLYRAAGGVDVDDIARIRKLADPAPQILERAHGARPRRALPERDGVRGRAGRAHGRRPRRPDPAHAGPVRPPTRAATPPESLSAVLSTVYTAGP